MHCHLAGIAGNEDFRQKLARSSSQVDYPIKQKSILMKLYLFVTQGDGGGGDYSASYCTHAIYAISREIAVEKLGISENEIEREDEISDPFEGGNIETPSFDYL